MKQLLVVLLAGILLFGCTQPGGGAQAGTGGTSGGTGAAGGAGTGGTGGTAGETGTAGGATGGTGGGGTGSGFSMEAWSMEALASAGMPMKCTVTWGGEAPGTYDIYVIGQKSRMEGTYQVQGRSQPFVSILKNEKLYMPASMMGGAEGMEGCDWVSFDAGTEGASEPGQTTSSYQMVDYDAPPVSYECNPAVFGDEKFATPGRVCDFQQMMQDQYGSYCDQLTGEDREQCLEAFGHS